MIVSDCDAINNILTPHAYAANATDMARLALAAGTDLDCGGALTTALPDALSAGAVTLDQLRSHLTNLFTLRFSLGEYDADVDQTYRAIPESAVCTNASIALAISAAVQGIVLLKNSGATLPFSTSTTQTLAIIGPLAARSDVMQSNYKGIACPGTLQPLTEAFDSYAVTVNYALGCNVSDMDTSGFAEAVAAASSADAVIVVAGLDLSIEAEALDRTSIAWPGVQSRLIAAVAAAAKRPIVLVIMAGGAIDVSAELANNRIGAILWTGYPGQGGAVAIASAVYGDIIPAGRLTQTIYPATFTSNVSFLDMGMLPGPSAFPPGVNPGRTHRYYTGPTVLPFGYGLSYVSWTYDIVAAPVKISLAPSTDYILAHATHGALFAPLVSPIVATVSVRVTNVDVARAADDVVLVFLIPPGAGKGGMPLETLIGFERISVAAGAWQVVSFNVSARDLTSVVVVGPETIRRPIAGAWLVRIGRQYSGGFTEVAFTAVCDGSCSPPRESFVADEVAGIVIGSSVACVTALVVAIAAWRRQRTTRAPMAAAATELVPLNSRSTVNKEWFAASGAS